MQRDETAALWTDADRESAFLEAEEQCRYDVEPWPEATDAERNLWAEAEQPVIARAA